LLAGGVLAAVAAFLTYGMGKNAMATAFQALIADVFDKRQRAQATAVLQSAFIMGIVGGSVFLGRLLDPYSPERLLMLVAAVGALVIILAVLGCTGVEPVGLTVETVSQRARAVPFGKTLKLTIQNRQVRLFFFFVGLTLLATLSQDIYLEPYAAELLDMSVGQTARLNMFWGIGTLAALLSSGMWLVNRFGRKPTAATGLVIVAFSFVGLILSGAMESRPLFLMLVFVLGVGSGLSAAGALTLMVDFTMPEQAGLLMGAWTVAHQLAEVVGNIMGGVVIDTVFAVSNSYLAAFSTVFGLEVVAAIAALTLLSRLSVAAFLTSEMGSAEALSATLS
jgi:BCD family chlorophyll transporter-like MFS transporter